MWAIQDANFVFITSGAAARYLARAVPARDAGRMEEGFSSILPNGPLLRVAGQGNLMMPRGMTPARRSS